MLKITTLYSFLTRSVVEVPYTEAHDAFPFGSLILFAGEYGKEIGRLVHVNETAMNEEKVNKEATIDRLATEEELEQMRKNQEQERDLLRKLYEKIDLFHLEMKPVSASISLAGDLIFFTFIADERVDFREMAKEMSREMQKKVFLYQVGPRDEAMIIGGHGKCGQKQCCTRFLTHLPSVTMDSARDQNMAHKGAEGLAGQCGKLMCCLNYEAAEYRRLKGKFPKFGTTIQTPDSRRGVVAGLDILNEKVKVRFENEMETQVFDLQELVK